VAEGVGSLSRGMLFLCLQVAAFWPVWRWYAARLTDGSDEPWGVLALVTVLFFLLQKGRLREAKGIPLAVSGLFVLIYAAAFPKIPPLGRAVLAVLAIGCLASASCFGRTVHLGMVGLLLLSLPVIASLQFFLGYPVRYLTAIVASKLIGLTGYHVVPQGTCLHWMGEIVSVDAPCSGVRMLWSGLYLNFTLACFTGLDSFRTWLAYAFSVAAIFFGNTIRASALFFTESGIVRGGSWAHQAVGLAVFFMVGLAIVRFHRFIRRTGVDSAWT
jgi:exosortase/archaeosortase family protein